MKVNYSNLLWGYTKWHPHLVVFINVTIKSIPSWTVIFLTKYAIRWKCQCERGLIYLYIYITSRVRLSFLETSREVGVTIIAISILTYMDITMAIANHSIIKAGLKKKKEKKKKKKGK